MNTKKINILFLTLICNYCVVAQSDAGTKGQSKKNIFQGDNLKKQEPFQEIITSDEKSGHSYMEMKNPDEQKPDETDHRPVYVNTGDPVGDESRYHTAKEEWVKNFPAEYNNWIKSSSADIHKISSIEFKNMPKEKQDNILNNPEKYIIIIENE